jgi:Ran GTPase-activating protein (RanGAP) involved in mRNA processing and transport
VYSFEKFFDQYNYYTNVPERNLKIDIENGLCTFGEAVDNIKHTLKYYYPQIIRMDNCFSAINDDSNNNYLANIGYMNKVLASINYYQPKISQLSFINNKLNKIFNSTILSCIKLIKTLTMLDLSNNELNEENIRGLCEYLKQNKTIKILYLNNNNLSSACGFYLADSFKNNSTIEVLHLSHNKLNESGCDSFFNILSNDNTSLLDLDISYNELSFLDFSSLSKYLNSNPPLKKLDISGNILDPQSANSIGVTFKKLTNLEELKINNCRITDQSIQVLIPFLNLSSIQNIEIDSNEIKIMGLMLILKQIQVSNKLKYISYQNNSLEMLIGMFIQTLTANNSIETINLKQNVIKEDELKQFVNASSKLNNVKIIFSKDKVPNNASEMLAGNKNIILQ